MKGFILNGLPLYDQNGQVVNAHGAGIIKENVRYYLFGEYKQDDSNGYNGFSCYSSENLGDWRFEGLALKQDVGERLNANRVGERVKVVKSAKTGKFVMMMHTDDLKYNDPCICYAVSDKVEGPYEFAGPLKFRGENIRRWDMGTYTDDDGKNYLLTHEGYIYRLSDECTEAEELLCSEFAPGGEAPAMCKKDGLYYIMFSGKTSWERNDNYYFTSSSLAGPWEYRGYFCKEGSLTYNTQCSFLLNTGEEIVYLGDRWSFPKQGSAATLVMLPVELEHGQLSIREYKEVWSIKGETKEFKPKRIDFCSDKRSECFKMDFIGSRVALFGKTDKHGGYAEVSISKKSGEPVHSQIIDFYSLVEMDGLRYVSPALKADEYEIKVTPLETAGEWFKKDGTRFGSDGYKVELTGVMKWQ